MTGLKVLQLTNMYPTESVPNYGTFVKSQVDSLRSFGVESDVMFIDGRKGASQYVRAIPELRKRLRTTRYDLIHAHYGLSGIVARCQFDVPVVLSFCGKDVLGDFSASGRKSLGSWIFTVIHKALAPFCDAIIVKSDAMAAVVPTRSSVIANGVNFDAFKPLDRAECRRSLNLDSAATYVLFPYATSKPRKNFPAVEGALTILKTLDPDRDYRTLIVSNVPNEDIPTYMGAADVLALPSFSEGSPNAVKEALACNLPVVAAAIGDIPALLDGLPGCALTGTDAQSVAAAIKASLDAPRPLNLRDRRLGLSAEHAATAVLDVYRGVFDRRAPVRPPRSSSIRKAKR